MAVALTVAVLLDRTLARRGPRLAQAVVRAATSRRRPTPACASCAASLYAAIIMLGIAVALSQFTGINRLAASLLASGAIAAAIVGFAARQTLANFVAGIMLAITQPIRVGDWVSFEDQYGVVEDVRLNYTFLRTPGDQRVVIPNERLASGILRNDTLGSAERRPRRAGVAARRAPTPRAPSPCCRPRRARRSRWPRWCRGARGSRVGGELVPAARARRRARRRCGCGACGACRRRGCSATHDEERRAARALAAEVELLPALLHSRARR